MKLNLFKVLFIISLCAVFITSKSQTSLYGVITQDSILDISSSPYMVTDDIYVDSGVTLTIAAGTDIIFTGNFAIYIYGRLDIAGSAGQRIVLKGEDLGTTPPSNALWKGIRLMDSHGFVTVKNANISHAEVAIDYSLANYAGMWKIPDFDIENAEFSNNITAVAGSFNSTAGNIKGCSFTNNTIGISGMTDTMAYSLKPFAGGSSVKVQNCTFTRNDIAVSRVSQVIQCVFDGNRRAAYIEFGTVGLSRFHQNDTGLVTHSSITEACIFTGNNLGYWHVPVYGISTPRGIDVVSTYFGYNKTGVFIDTGANVKSINCNNFRGNGVGIRLAAQYYAYGAVSPDSFKVVMNIMKENDTAVYFSPVVQKVVMSWSPDSIIMRLAMNWIDSSQHYHICNASKNDLNVFENYLGDSAAIENKLYDGTDNMNVGFISYEIAGMTQVMTGMYMVGMKYMVVKNSAATTIAPSSTIWTGMECVSHTVGIPGRPSGNAGAFTAYPNPFNTQLYIKAEGLNEKATVQMFDATGRLVIEEEMYQTEYITLDTEQLAGGLYILRIQSGGQTQSIKVIK